MRIQAPQTSSHIARIDLLRGIAILIVFSNHVYLAFHGILRSSWKGNWFTWADSPSATVQVLRMTVFDGALGVCLFFVVSGLCIRLSQLSASTFPIKFFYWRRFWRICPPYLLALLIFTIAQNYRDFRDIIAHVFMVHNFSRAYFMSINAPFWSLSMEIQVYLLYPVLLFLHDRLGKIRTGGILIGLSVASMVIGGESFRNHFHLPGIFAILRQMPTVLWFTWYTGFLIAEAIASNTLPNRLTRVGLLVAIIGFLLSHFLRPLTVFGPVLSGVVIALLTWEVLVTPLHCTPLRKVLACLGVCSYSFYLYFDQIIQVILHELRSHVHIGSKVALFAITYPLALLIVFVISYVAYRTVEMGSIALGRWLRTCVGMVPKSARPVSQ